METEHGAHDELPDEPQHAPDSAREEETLPDEQTGAAQAGQEAPDVLPDGEANKSEAAQPVDNLPDEQTEESDAVEPVATSETAEQEAPKAEPEAASVPDEQGDVLAAGSVPTRQKSAYTNWIRVLAIVVLMCVLGGVVLVLRQSTNGHGQVVSGTPTPIPPLSVKKWCTVKSAPVDTQGGHVYLTRIAPLSANDAWMLGSINKDTNNGAPPLDALTAGSQSTPLLEHWNGKSWSVVPTADPSALFKQLQGKIQHLPGETDNGQVSNEVDLNDIAALSDNNIWIVGEISISSQSTISGFSGVPLVETVGQPLIEHWDGHSWQIVASSVGVDTSNPFASHNGLKSISALSANDIWAMGTQAPKIDGNSSGYMSIGGGVPLVEHWDGTSWTEKPLPTALQQQGMMFSDPTLQALSANDVWSFDQEMTFQSAGPGELPPGLTPVPYDPSGNPSPSGPPVAVTVTISKSFVQVQNSAHILHWNGQGWSEMQLPDALSKHVLLSNVTFLADNNIWALGSEWINVQGTPVDAATASGSHTLTHLIYHWDGTTWSQITNTPDADGTSRFDGMSVIAPDNLWLLGHTSQNQPLLEHWNGKYWSLAASPSPAYGSAFRVIVTGQHAWALVDEYSASNAQNSQPLEDFAPLGTVLETNC